MTNPRARVLCIAVLALLAVPRAAVTQDVEDGNEDYHLVDAGRWGMRSNLYYGAKTHHTSPVMTGLAWVSGDRVENLRHGCNDEHKLQNWGWHRHDGRSFGQQTIGDSANGVVIHTDFIWQNSSSGNAADPTAPHTLRVRGEAASAHGSPSNVSLFFYVGTSEGTVELLTSSKSNSGRKVGQKKYALFSRGIPDASVVLAGRDTSAGDWNIVVTEDAETKHPLGARTTLGRTRVGRKGRNDPENTSPELANTHFLGVQTPPDSLWRVEDVLKNTLSQSRFAVHQEVLRALQRHAPPDMPVLTVPNHIFPIPTLPNSYEEESNLAVLQFVVQVPFSIDVAFLPDDPTDPPLPSSPKRAEPAAYKRAVKRASHILSDALTDDLEAAASAFDRRFESLFPEVFGSDKSGIGTDDALDGAERGLQVTSDDGVATDRSIRMARHALSNLLGGITFFSGRSIVQYVEGGRAVESPPYSLLTGVPSRSFFPRGFLWDEGFHQLLVSRWDPELSREVIMSWLSSMNEHGWIAREQILGLEARSRVPEQFRVQKPDIANPPTILLAVQSLLARSTQHPQKPKSIAMVVNADGESVEDPEAVAAHQQAVQEREATLDFARRVYPLLKRHYGWFRTTQRGPVVDSFQWRGATQDHTFASGLDDFPRGHSPSDDDEHVDLLSWMAMAAHLLADIARVIGEDGTRYDLDAQRYVERLQFHWSETHGVYCDIGTLPPKPANRNKPRQVSYEMGLVCHPGYVGLFPFLLRLLPPDAPELGRMLSVIADPEQLWSKYGIRSLSKSDPLFGTKEDYWRGAVWVNLNFLALKALRHYEAAPGPYREVAADLHHRLRANVVANIDRQYAQTGFLWENYDSRNGKGRGTHPFTGWTALVALILADDY